MIRMQFLKVHIKYYNIYMDDNNVDLFFLIVNKMLTPKSDQQMAITQLERVFMISWELAPLEPSPNIQNLNPEHAHYKNKSSKTYSYCKFTSEIFFIKNSILDLVFLIAQ